MNCGNTATNLWLGLQPPEKHRHSGIGLHTPATVHDDTAHQIQARRAEVLNTAYTANPEHFRRRPTPPPLPTKAWINQPPTTIENQETPHNNRAA